MDFHRRNSMSGSNTGELVLIRCQYDKIPIREFDFSTEVFNNLKKNYEDRISCIEFQFKKALDLVENDELLMTMKRNQTTDEFRKQRIFEILEEPLLAEMESTIERLNKSNALLKAELTQTVDENLSQKQYHTTENEILKAHAEKLENSLKKHEQLTLQLGQEREQLHAKLRQTIDHYDHQIKNNEAYYNQNVQELQAEVSRLHREVEDLRHSNEELENTKMKSDAKIADMKHDIEVLRAEYSKNDKSFRSLTFEHDSLIKSMAHYKELNSKLEEEIERSRAQNQEYRIEIEAKNSEIILVKGEKEELSIQIEKLQAQFQKLTDNEQKTLSLKMKELKEKYKLKIKGMKEKLNELKVSNEAFVTENQTLKHTLEERNLQYEGIISNIQNDMIVIKNEWEKKCQEIELTSQRSFAEQKSKYQSQINQIQGEYQMLLEKRTSELHSESTLNVSKSRTYEFELRTHLENRIAQMEKDYISRAKHENILAAETMELKAAHAQGMKELEEKYEQEIQIRAKHLADKSKYELELALNSLKNANRSIEEQKVELMVQIENLRALVDSEKENNDKIKDELIESEQNRKILMAKLEESTTYIQKLKSLYEKEASKSSLLEESRIQLQQKLDEHLEFGKNQSQSLEELKKDVSEFSKNNTELQKNLELAQAKCTEFERETNELRSTISNLTQERDKLAETLKEMRGKVLQESSHMEMEITKIRLEGVQKIEHEIEDKLRLRSALQQTENQLKIQQNENSELQRKFNSYKEEYKKLEEQFLENELQKNNLKLDNSRLEQQIEELQKNLNKNAKAYRDNLEKMKVLSKLKISNLRLEYESIKKSVVVELQAGYKIFQEGFEGIARTVEERTEGLREELTREKERIIESLNFEYQSKLKKLECNANDEKLRAKQEYENVVSLQTGTLEQVKQGLNQLREENHQLLKLLEDSNKECERLRTRLQELETEKGNLKAIIDDKVSEFESLQKYVHKEIKRLNEENGALLRQSVNETKDYYEKELTRIKAQFEDLQAANLRKLTSVNSELEKVQGIYESEIENLQNSFQLKIDNYENELEMLEHDFLRLKKEKQTLTMEIDRMSQNYRDLQDDNYKIISEFEEKIAALNELSRADSEKCSHIRAMAVAECEKYQRELKALKAEIVSKDEVIKEVQAKCEKFEMQLFRVKSQALGKENSYPAPKQPGCSAIDDVRLKSNSRERDLDELKTMLSRSIQAFNTSIDSNVKTTSELESERMNKKY